jgi:hypothetical protein
MCFWGHRSAQTCRIGQGCLGHGARSGKVEERRSGQGGRQGVWLGRGTDDVTQHGSWFCWLGCQLLGNTVRAGRCLELAGGVPCTRLVPDELPWARPRQRGAGLRGAALWTMTHTLCAACGTLHHDAMYECVNASPQHSRHTHTQEQLEPASAPARAPGA